MEPVLDTPTEPAEMTPATRFLRTLLQIAVALVPALVAVGWLELTAEQTAIVTGALVAAISALHNAYNQSHATKRREARDRGDISLEWLLGALIIVVLFIILLRHI